MKVKYLLIKYQYLVRDLPNFSRTGSISGMKKLYYGKDSLLVRCGSFIYNVSSKPNVYHTYAH